MPFTLDQILDAVTAFGLVVLGATPIAHMLVRFAKGLRTIAAATATKWDDQRLEEVVVGLEWFANGLDKLAAILPRLTMGRISPAVVQAAVDEVQP